MLIYGEPMKNFTKNLNKHLSEAFSCKVEILDISHKEVLQALSILYELYLHEFDKYSLKETIFTII